MSEKYIHINHEVTPTFPGLPDRRITRITINDQPSDVPVAEQNQWQQAWKEEQDIQRTVFPPPDVDQLLRRMTQFKIIQTVPPESPIYQFAKADLLANGADESIFVRNGDSLSPL